MNQISEVRILPNVTKDPNKEKPLRDNETIRVYHGFNEFKDAIKAAKTGLSGKEIAKRIYSFEGNNNPKGLFVTTDLKVAKNFTSSYGVAVVMEFHVKGKDLQAPTWPSGGYTVQGGYSQYFKDSEEREEARARDRKLHSDSKFETIAKSDQPELANSLLNSSEMQALFVGDLNPNMIRAFWIAKPNDKGNQIYNNKFERMSRTEFLKKFDDKLASPSANWRLFKPTDEFDEVLFYQKIKDTWKIDKEEARDTFKYLASDDSSLLSYVWPKQLPAFKKSLR